MSKREKRLVVLVCTCIHGLSGLGENVCVYVYWASNPVAFSDGKLWSSACKIVVVQFYCKSVGIAWCDALPDIMNGRQAERAVRDSAFLWHSTARFIITKQNQHSRYACALHRLTKYIVPKFQYLKLTKRIIMFQLEKLV